MKNIILLLIIIALCGQIIFAQKNEKNIKRAGILVMDNWNEAEKKPLFSAILGGFESGKYVTSKNAVGLTENKSFTLYGLNGANKGEVNITKLDTPMEEICEDYYSIETDKTAHSGVLLSSDISWNPMPRIPKALSTKDATYQKIVRDLLIGKGLKNPKVKIDQIYRIDLEGDGKDEVIIRGTNYKDGFSSASKAGDYSFILVRKLVTKTVGKSKTKKEVVENILLDGNFYPKTMEFNAPNQYNLTAFADLNGDGIMEIVLYGEYYEGSWVEAYTFSGDKPLKVLETGCGV